MTHAKKMAKSITFTLACISKRQHHKHRDSDTSNKNALPAIERKRDIIILGNECKHACAIKTFDPTVSQHLSYALIASFLLCHALNYDLEGMNASRDDLLT